MGGESSVWNVPHEGVAHLFTNVFPAVCTLLSVLDDRIVREEPPRLGENVQNGSKGDKADDTVNEGATGDNV